MAKKTLDELLLELLPKLFEEPKALQDEWFNQLSYLTGRNHLESLARENIPVMLPQRSERSVDTFGSGDVESGDAGRVYDQLYGRGESAPLLSGEPQVPYGGTEEIKISSLAVSPLLLIRLWKHYLRAKGKADQKIYQNSLTQKIQLLMDFFTDALPPKATKNFLNFKNLLEQILLNHPIEGTQLLFFIQQVKDLYIKLMQGSESYTWLQKKLLEAPLTLSAFAGYDSYMAANPTARETVNRMKEEQLTSLTLLLDIFRYLEMTIHQIESSEYMDNAFGIRLSGARQQPYFNSVNYNRDLQAFVNAFSALIAFLATHPEHAGFQRLSLLENLGKRIFHMLKELRARFPEVSEAQQHDLYLFVSAGMCELMRTCYGSVPEDLEAIGKNLGFCHGWRGAEFVPLILMGIPVILVLLSIPGFGFYSQLKKINFPDMRSVLSALEAVMTEADFNKLVAIFNEIFKNFSQTVLTFQDIKWLFTKFVIGSAVDFVVPLEVSLLLCFCLNHRLNVDEFAASPIGQMWMGKKNPWHVVGEYSRGNLFECVGGLVNAFLQVNSADRQHALQNLLEKLLREIPPLDYFLAPAPAIQPSIEEGDVFGSMESTVRVEEANATTEREEEGVGVGVEVEAIGGSSAVPPAVAPVNAGERQPEEEARTTLVVPGGQSTTGLDTALMSGDPNLTAGTQVLQPGEPAPAPASLAGPSGSGFGTAPMEDLNLTHATQELLQSGGSVNTLFFAAEGSRTDSREQLPVTLETERPSVPGIETNAALDPGELEELSAELAEDERARAEAPTLRTSPNNLL